VSATNNEAKKLCVKCGNEKAPKEFHTDAKRKDGLFPYCKECRKKPKRPAYFRPLDLVLADYEVSVSGCWNWTGTLNVYGYGLACYKAKRIGAHRLSLLNHLGIEETDLLALHHCDNPACINPDHLYLGTPAENSRDMVNRGRVNAPFGENAKNSKLKDHQVISIFNDSRRHKEIAKDHGIAASTVSSIKTGRIWPHLTGGVTHAM
jgi:hypothetical protein